MKNRYKIFPITLVFIGFLLFAFSSCDKMNDIQEEYASRSEQVYLGKVDSLKYYPGFGRAKVTWYVGSDPKINRTIIYWNMRKDSLVKEFVRTTSGIQKDSVVFENLSEGSTLFEFRNVNNKGETSLFSSLTVKSWGAAFADGLRARRLKGSDFSYETSIFNLSFTPSTQGDSVAYSQVVYKNTLGQEKTLRIERETLDVQLPDFPDGGEFSFRTVFFPPQGIDTVYNDYAKFNAPKVLNDRGFKIAKVGSMTSTYFDRNGEFIYEWNAAGDIIKHTVSPAGEMTVVETFVGIAPHTIYKHIFFYDDDIFITVFNAGNNLSMQRIEGGQLKLMKTPAGTDALGAGFGFARFIPTKGYFISDAGGTSGELKKWLAKNDVTWGAPNGVVMGKDYHIYEPLMLFNHQSLLGVDAAGFLWSTSLSVGGVLGGKTRIGKGWNRFKKITSIGKTLICMEANGDFYVFPNFSGAQNFWIVE